MLIDGDYNANADPYPGNALIMPDGRLDLLDYGMVGRMSAVDRGKAVKTVLALADGNVERTAAIYTAAGYQAQLRVECKTRAYFIVLPPFIGIVWICPPSRRYLGAYR